MTKQEFLDTFLVSIKEATERLPDHEEVRKVIKDCDNALWSIVMSLDEEGKLEE